MDFLKLAQDRHSVRAYLPKPVEREKALAILEAARVAPTAANRQPQRILVVQDPVNLIKFEKVCRYRKAPLMFIVCAKRDEAWVRTQDRMVTTQIDASIVTDHMMLAAASLGLGSLWMTAFDPVAAREQFSVPEDLEIVNILCVGYEDGDGPAAGRHAFQRKPLAETVSWETF